MRGFHFLTLKGVLGSKKDQNSFAECVNHFGKTIADKLLQCDPKDWKLIKKKIFDLFFDYEHGNLTPRRTPSIFFNNYGNFTFPNVARFQNYGYSCQNYGYNSQTQPLQQCNQPLQPPQTLQDPYSPSTCDSNNSG